MPRAVLRFGKNDRPLLVVMEVDPDPDNPGQYVWRCHECKVWTRLSSKREAIVLSPSHANMVHRAFNEQPWRELYGKEETPPRFPRPRRI